MNFAPGSAAWLAALCSSRVLGATWFVAYSAVLPLTQAAWGLSGREAGLIQLAFHLGYLISLFIVGFLADHFGAKRTYLLTGIAAWASLFLFVFFAEGFWPVLAWISGFYCLRQTPNTVHPRPAGESLLAALLVALLVALACLYNFAGIADSSTHSTVLAESVPPHSLGVAYAVRSVIGFGAGVVSPVVFGWALDHFSGNPHAWGFAWMTLGLGALLGPVATLKLRRAA